MMHFDENSFIKSLLTNNDKFHQNVNSLQSHETLLIPGNSLGALREVGTAQSNRILMQNFYTG